MTTTTPKKKNTRIQAENQQKIIRAALDVFSRYGYRGSTVDQIASKADMSKANLLYYFRRKNDIYIAVLESILDRWLEPLAAINSDGDPGDELWAYIQAKLRMSRENPEASRLFATEILQGAPMIKPFLTDQMRVLIEEKCSVLQGWIDDGKIADVPPMHIIFMIWASTQHYADFQTQIDALTDASTEQVYANAEHALKVLLLGGLLKPQQ